MRKDSLARSVLRRGYQVFIVSMNSLVFLFIAMSFSLSFFSEMKDLATINRILSEKRPPEMATQGRLGR
jgi:hypothetical protein